MASLVRMIALLFAGGMACFAPPSHADEALTADEIAPILKRHPCSAACTVQAPSFQLTLRPLDLNGDGTAEYHVADTSCGSGGCAEALFMHTPNGWTKLIGVSVGGIEVMKTQTKGIPDVVMHTVSHEGPRRDVKTIYRWDGYAYRTD